MTDFTPQHYLAAARIADRDEEWYLAYGWPQRKKGLGAFDPGDHDYRALREALDKEYRIAIYWWGDAWLSEPNIDRDYGIPCMDGDDITNLMMKNVVALVEAGVVK